MPLVFIDDIDRAAPVDQRESFVGIMKLLSDIKPAVMLVPMRPALRQDHFTRQAWAYTLFGLEPEFRKILLGGAIENERNESKRRELEERFTPDVVDHLVKMSGVPYALLAWANAIALYDGEFAGVDTIHRALAQWVQNLTTFTIDALVELASKFGSADMFIDQDAVSEDPAMIKELLSSGIVEPDNLYADRKRLRLVSHFRFLKSLNP